MITNVVIQYSIQLCFYISINDIKWLKIKVYILLRFSFSRYISRSYVRRTYNVIVHSNGVDDRSLKNGHNVEWFPLYCLPPAKRCLERNLS